jgi:hypothetical protein
LKWPKRWFTSLKWPVIVDNFFHYEEALRKKLKLKLLGLSSLQRMVTRQVSRILWLKEGDACTRFFHTHANGRRPKNHIHSLEHEGRTLLSEDSKAEATFSFLESIMGTLASRSNSINLDGLNLPQLNLNHLSLCFTKSEV